MPSASGGLRLPDQGLCPWTPLRAPPKWWIQDFWKGGQLVPLECPKPFHALSPSDC